MTVVPDQNLGAPGLKIEARPNIGIEPYTGPWNSKTASHLLRRTLFGNVASEISAAVAMPLDQVLSVLLQDQPAPAPPVDPTTGQTWIGQAFDSTNDSRYQGYLTAWWFGLMMRQGISLREKMVLFWHNHFVSEYSTVPDSRYMYLQNTLFRRHALGNIKELVKAVSVDPAMLIYLNGTNNRGDGSSIPDENYGRELLELFTIGKGPQIGSGDYTNYTENDVKAAARLLTGWRAAGYRDAKGTATGSYFDAARHDTKDKLFSSAFQNSRITGGADGQRELNDLVEMIFRQPETAKFLCRKLYRWFVYYDIDATIESRVIEPLAEVMRQNNFELKPVLNTLFRSAHFFDEGNVGCLIRNPIDFTTGAFRGLGIAIPSPDTQTAAHYSLTASLRGTASTLQMNPMEPPNVAGWPAYYQSPDFHRLWINSVTLPNRWKFTDSLINGFSAGGVRFAADAIALAQQASNPKDPYSLATDLAGRLFPLEITTNQRDYLVRNVLMPGLPDYEWTTIWVNFTTDPGSTSKRTAAATRLNNLLKFMMRMAEFELA